MSIQWTIVTGFLYFEIAVVIILISPLFSPKYYSYFYHCRLFTTLKRYTRIYFFCFLVLLCVILRDSSKEMLKYSQPLVDLKDRVKLNRAEKNFCNTVFSILLALVIKQLITMFRNHHKLLLKTEAITIKAESTMKLVKTRLSETKQVLEECKLKGFKKLATIQGQEEGEAVGQGDEFETS